MIAACAQTATLVALPPAGMALGVLFKGFSFPCLVGLNKLTGMKGETVVFSRSQHFSFSLCDVFLITTSVYLYDQSSVSQRKKKKIPHRNPAVEMMVNLIKNILFSLKYATVFLKSILLSHE